MPLSVDIRINDALLHTVHIGRLEKLRHEGAEHRYIAWVSYPDGRSTAVVAFTHTYSDGADVCVRKALEALGH